MGISRGMGVLEKITSLGKVWKVRMMLEQIVSELVCEKPIYFVWPDCLGYYLDCKWSLTHWLAELFAKNAFFGHSGDFQAGYGLN